MKLYTEEQVKEAMETALIPPIYQQDLWGHLTPIELPSDEEIDAISKKIGHDYFDMYNINHYQGLEEGAWRMAYCLMEYLKQQENGN